MARNSKTNVILCAKLISDQIQDWGGRALPVPTRGSSLSPAAYVPFGKSGHHCDLICNFVTRSPSPIVALRLHPKTRNGVKKAICSKAGGTNLTFKGTHPFGSTHQACECVHEALVRSAQPSSGAHCSLKTVQKFTSYLSQLHPTRPAQF